MSSEELNQRLKKAKFPRKDFRCSNCVENNYTSCTVCEDAVEGEPDLNELIAACVMPPHHFSLYARDKDRYEATFIRLSPFGAPNTQTTGYTAQEAVKLLWLELNENGGK